jgi:hypothetical protein
LSIRPHFHYPTRATIKGKRAHRRSGDHVSEINHIPGFNPALERRIRMKLLTAEFGTSSRTEFIDINYMIVDPIYETAYRSDVRRVETSNKMSIKPLESDKPRDEEFNPVTTSYRDLMKIMLQLKFENLYQEKLQHADEQYEERAKKIFKAERARKAAARNFENLSTREIEVVNQELKADEMRQIYGPFYQLYSKEGILEDNFVNCGYRDLIDYANKEVMKLLIIGKPRSGKSTLARNIAAKLDLVRISVDAWIENFFKIVKQRIDDPPPYEPVFETKKVVNEAGEEVEEQVELPPPEWRTPLQVSVQETLKKGGDLKQEDMDAMIADQVRSNLASTKGFVLDLDFTKNAGVTWAERLLGIVESSIFTHVIELQLDDDEVYMRSAHIR